MLDILCVGESVIDIFLRIAENDPRFSVDREQNKLLINFGDKLTVEKYIIGIGGNASNTAVGTARLGLKTGLCAEIGKDEFSQKITSTLEKEGVDTKCITINGDKQTPVTVALSYDGERTLFTEYVERQHNFNLEDTKTKLVYLTSLSNVWQPAYENVLNFVGKTGALLAFNPGTIQLEHKNKTVIDVIEKTDYLFVNKQEAEEILYGKELGINEENNKNLIKKLLFGLKTLGTKNVIITDSDNGSYLQSADNKTYHLEIIKVKVVEKTGAGDSYTAGFMSAVLNGLDVKDAMIWGSINSSQVIQKIGAQNGLLTKTEINDIKSTLTDYSPKEI